MARGYSTDTFEHFRKRVYGAVKASEGHVQYLEVDVPAEMGYAVAQTKDGLMFSQGAGKVELRVTLPMAPPVARVILEDLQKVERGIPPALCHMFIKGVQNAIRSAS
jgi:hypothetical protein